MDFNAFPVDIQVGSLSCRKSDQELEFIQNIVKVCKFRVGSFNYPMNKIIFYNELIPEDTIIKSILDYRWVLSSLSLSFSVVKNTLLNYSMYNLCKLCLWRGRIEKRKIPTI